MPAVVPQSPVNSQVSPPTTPSNVIPARCNQVLTREAGGGDIGTVLMATIVARTASAR
jgi:hypothetical protein